MKWFNTPRTFGNSAAQRTNIIEELRLANEVDFGKASRALELLVGKEWSKIPTRNMMDLVNKRLGTKPRDYSRDAIGSTILLLVDLVAGMSPDQIRFLSKFDHLPRTKKENGHWMDMDELSAYGRQEEDIHQRKMEVYLMTNGIISAQEQGGSRTPKASFKVSPIVVLIAVAILFAVVLFIF